MFGWRIVLLGRPGSDGRQLHLSVGWIVLLVAVMLGLGSLVLLTIGSVAGSWLHDATALQ